MSNFERMVREIAAIYDELHRIGNLGPDPSHGFLRAAYSPEEQRAFDLFEKLGNQMGLESRIDALGNLSLEYRGASGRFLEAGSHLDTVPMGGNFDGAAGVVTGLVAFRELLRSPLQHGLRLRIWRCEEASTFNTVCFGSRAAFGTCGPEVLDHRFEATSLRDAMKASGFDPGIVERRERTITRDEVDAIDAHVELHIEQASVLESRGVDLGIVTGMRGSTRSRIFLRGSFDHSGGTPMGLPHRKDANLALAYILVALDDLARHALADGHDLVQTVGVVNSDRALNERYPEVHQNSIAKVSGFAYFTLDVRSLEERFREQYVEKAAEIIRSQCSKFGVELEFQIFSKVDAVSALDRALLDQLERSAGALSYSTLRLPSGAYHDAAIVAQQKRSNGTAVPTGMLFIPCRNGRSHCPEEFTSYEAIAKGAETLAAAYPALASTRI